MPPKDVSFDKSKFHKGMKIAARAVGSTIGPMGKNVFLGDPTLPRFTNDGASIANKIILKDPEEDAGAWVIRSATARAADEAGDGTTTTAVIAEALFDAIQGRSEEMVDIKRSLYEALPEIQSKIKASSRTTTLKDIRHIAEVSAEHKELAELVSTIFEKKGVEAQVTVQDSGDAKCSIEMRDGYEAKVGMMSPYLVTNYVKQTSEYKDVPVLCTHKKVDAITQLLPLYEKLGEKKLSKLIIICDDMDIAALGAIIDNKRRGTFSTLVIRATGELLDDIASVVGATPVSESTGTDFADADLLKKLGMASSVVSTVGTVTTQGRTVFVGKSGAGSKQRATYLEAQAGNLTNGFERSAVLKRAGKLRSGVAVLSVGAYSEQELGYLRDKADDAIKAVRSALEEGYVEGGGMCLYRIAESLSEQSVGRVLLKQALQAPFKKIIENSGKDYTKVVKDLGKNGYDAKEAEYKDLIKAGIIDPAKVERVAVESAISSIGEMLVTEALVVDYVDHENKG